MKHSIPFIAVLFMLVGVTGVAGAQGLVVYDPENYSQTLTQINQMAKDYQKQLEQLDQAIRQTGAMTGTRGMGSLANGDLEFALRRYLPHTWQQTMDMMNAGNLLDSAGNTQNLYKSLYETYAPVSGAVFMAGDPDGPIATALDRRTNTTYAAMAASEQAYNNIAARMDTYETLLKKLDTSTDLKSSIDLQARIEAENGMVLNELMRLNAIQMQQKTSEDNDLLTNYRRASSVNRYDATKAAQAFTLNNPSNYNPPN